MTRRITSTGCRGRGLAKQSEGSAGRKGLNVDGAVVVNVVKVKSAKFRNELWPSGEPISTRERNLYYVYIFGFWRRVAVNRFGRGDNGLTITDSLHLKR